MPGLKPGDCSQKTAVGCSLHWSMFPPDYIPLGPGIRIGIPTSCPAFGAWQPTTYHDRGTNSTPFIENAKNGSPKHLKPPPSWVDSGLEPTHPIAGRGLVDYIGQAGQGHVHLADGGYNGHMVSGHVPDPASEGGLSAYANHFKILVG